MELTLAIPVGSEGGAVAPVEDGLLSGDDAAGAETLRVGVRGEDGGGEEGAGCVELRQADLPRAHGGAGKGNSGGAGGEGEDGGGELHDC